MKSAGVIIKFDELGRVVIPKSIRDMIRAYICKSMNPNASFAVAVII